MDLGKIREYVDCGSQGHKHQPTPTLQSKPGEIANYQTLFRHLLKILRQLLVQFETMPWDQMAVAKFDPTVAVRMSMDKLSTVLLKRMKEQRSWWMTAVARRKEKMVPMREMLLDPWVDVNRLIRGPLLGMWATYRTYPNI